MAQAGTNQYAEETVDEERVEQFVLNLLFFIKFANQQVSQHEADQPAEPVPAHRKRPNVEHLQVWVPDDIQ